MDEKEDLYICLIFEIYTIIMWYTYLLTLECKNEWNPCMELQAFYAVIVGNEIKCMFYLERNYLKKKRIVLVFKKK